MTAEHVEDGCLWIIGSANLGRDSDEGPYSKWVNVPLYAAQWHISTYYTLGVVAFGEVDTRDAAGYTIGGVLPST